MFQAKKKKNPRGCWETLPSLFVATPCCFVFTTGFLVSKKTKGKSGFTTFFDRFVYKLSFFNSLGWPRKGGVFLGKKIPAPP